MNTSKERETWPYDWQSVEEALDVGTIEAHGHYMLHRALNTKRLIAFVGSGVSMAYGRVAWAELARLHVETVRDLARDTEVKKLLETDARLRALVAYIDDLSGKPDELYGDTLYAALHSCEQVWRLAAALYLPLFKRLVGLFDLPPGDEQGMDWREPPGEEWGSNLFRQWIKRETLDEGPHVRRLVRGWRPDPKTVDNSLTGWIPWPVLKRYAEQTDRQLRAPWAAVKELVSPRKRLLRSGVGKQPQHFAALFHEKFVNALAGTAPGQSSTLASSEPERWIQAIDDGLRSIRAAMLDELKKSGQHYLRPVHGFAVGLALDVARLMATQSGTMPPAATAPPPDTEDTVSHDIKRPEVIPPIHDPLHRLAFRLGIRRYLTTNYDLEIERLFVNMGYEAAQGAKIDEAGVDEVEMVGPGGGRTRDIVLTEKSAIDLIDFAANDSPHEFQVVHLHGRATEHHDVVVTEADYQKLYVRETASQTAFKEGIEIAFGGNPILFLGLSLSEGDILRPLREFMTGSSRRNRSVIALRDARDEPRKLQTFAKTAYARHGVMVIHYGRTKDGPKEYWLYEIDKAVCDLVNAIKEVVADLDKDDETLNKALERVGKCEFARDPLGNRPIIWRERFESDDGPCDIRFEIAVLEAIQSLVVPVTRLARHAPSGLPERLALSDFLKVSLQSAAERTRTSLVSNALNAKLEGLGRGWSRWWASWRDLPHDRSKHAHYERRITHRAVWFRHLDDSDADTVPGGSVTDTAPDGIGRATASDGGNAGTAPGDGAVRSLRKPENLKAFHEAVLAKNPNSKLANVPDSDGRRVFLLVGPQGAGKGFAYNAFARNGDDMVGGPEREYIGQLFATFSFGMEIASVWDALIGFLDNPMYNPNYLAGEPDDPNDPMAPDTETVHRRLVLASMSRLDALRRVLSDLPARLADILDNPDLGGPRLIGRVLVVFNAFDIVLNEDGEGKNSEVRQILALLLGRHAEAAPIDLVLMCRDNRIPSCYRRETTDASATAAAPEAVPLTLLLSNRQHHLGSLHRPGMALATGEADHADEDLAWVHRQLMVTLRASHAFTECIG